MAVFNQLSGINNGMDIPVKNYGGSDIAMGSALKIDTGNVPDTNKAIGVVVTTSDVGCIGFAVATIKAGGHGLMRSGGVAVGIAGAAITVGVPVMAAASGKVVTQTAALCQIGYALSKADVDTDAIQVLIAPAKNA
jgi:hypothetical protein